MTSANVRLGTITVIRIRCRSEVAYNVVNTCIYHQRLENQKHVKRVQRTKHITMIIQDAYVSHLCRLMELIANVRMVSITLLQLEVINSAPVHNATNIRIFLLHLESLQAVTNVV